LGFGNEQLRFGLRGEGGNAWVDIDWREIGETILREIGVVGRIVMSFELS
jgi:hypothetical protein